MNAVIARVSAVICTMSLMPVSAPLFAGAAEWINLSSWSYEEVSGFVSEGLLPACLGDSFDFTRPITRGEFAELLYSVLVNTGRISEESIYGQFADCADYPSVNKLDVNVFNGLACDGQNFLPTQVLTREEAALIFYNTLCSLYLLRYFEPQDGARASDTLNDSGDISSYALDAVDVMISGGFMSDTGDGDFEPRGEMTVEQAVAVMYRIYKWIPRLIYSDKEMLGENGERARTYDNGLEESFRDGKYVITDNGTELLSFDPDVYSKISCCDHSGRRLAFAVNFNDKTDVYDLDSGTVLFSIPYIVYRLEPEDGFVYVYSSRFMPAYSGLYSFDGKELAAPEYSEKELAAIAENGFEIMPEGYRDADGMIYYTDRDAKLYSVDSNGENKKLISDEGSTDIRYSDGKLFYNSADDGSLMCLADNRKYELSEGRAELLTMTSSVFYPELPRTEAGNVYKSDMYGNRTTDNYFIRRQYDTAVPNIGGGVIFGEAVRYTRIFTGSGEGESEKIRYAYRLYSARITEAGTETKKVAEFPATEMCFDVEGHKMYFLNAEEMEKNGDSPIYVYDGETVYELPGGVRAESFGFLYADGKADQDKIGYITKEEVGNGTYHVFDISNGDISEALLVESVIGSNGVIARYPSENETDRPVVIQKGDVLSVSFSGKDKVIENAVYIDMLGDLIYYRDSGEHDSGGVAGIMEAAVATDLWAYNYRTDEIIYISDDYAHRFIVSEYPEEILVYRTGANQYKLVDGETSESVWPNKGLFRYGETAVIECIATSGNDGGYLFKIDKDRNFVKLTDSTVKEWIYVPNGADKAKFSD